MRSTYELRSLCIKNNWFTCGSNEQYEKLMDQCREGALCNILAAMIWICSEDAELEEIAKILTENGF